MADMEVQENDACLQEPARIPHLEPEIDIGNLLSVDITPIEEKEITNSQDYLKQLAQKSIQILINKIWELPTESVEDAIVVKLPKGTTIIPREKPVPKAKPLTKWEQYAKEKGIHKNKKENLVWDETSKSWKPRYGYKRADNPKNDWLIEVPDNADPNTDVFQHKSDDRKERIAKNEFQRLRNIARAQKLKLPNNSLVQGDMPNKKQLSQAIVNAKRSTASIGKFSESLADNKQPKEMGKKRKFQSNFGDLNEEKHKSLKILENLGKKAPKLDVAKAVNYHNLEEQKNNSDSGKKFGNRKGSNGGSKKSGSKKSKSFIKKKQQRQQKTHRQQKQNKR